ncbi:TetR/AcrR family transcriptional regulator [Streptomyces sp. TS71-3]|uniref:TetR/AcrR family transcriptional regulator n=2 Tax=Streptomyces sp. TS71-3 TaxID=2733862 RepID=UPI001B0A4302|nr:TetR/AcrR family transcriptional regulator [Streptomyces sp. TS71-3]GHJ39507.1 TetR family transcriptional regulator [Streptomyces sp. TS71-3]
MTGRPRDPAVDDAIRRATLELAAEAGAPGVTMEGIAARSGVSKQTVYRRYGGKGEAILDALAWFAAARLPTPDTGSLRDDICVLLTATFAAQQGVSGVLNRALISEALQDENFTELLWKRLTGPRREEVAKIIRRARDRGEVSHPDEEFLIDLVFGPMWYRLLFDRVSLDRGYAAAIADTVAVAARLDGGEAALAP